MRVIISHDIDHLTVTEHYRDPIIPKFIARSKIELFRGSISLQEFFLRINGMIRNKWQCIDELMDFNKEQGIPATFFIGVNRGKGLVYSLERAGYWIRRIRENGFDTGVHGINHDTLAGVKKEHQIFREISGMESYGIRMHYLRRNENTLRYIEEAGYLFDSSEYGLRDPYQTGNLWEFPLHIMDGYIIEHNSRFQNTNLAKAKERTLRRIEEANALGCHYLTILFHDRYFNRGFRTWMEWYVWITGWLAAQGMVFTDYRSVMDELNSATKE